MQSNARVLVLSEGVQDEILTRLAKVADLKVISRTSTQHFKSAPENLPQIAEQLGVMNIVEDSVQKSLPREAAGNYLFLMKVDPLLTPLRGNPRFEALVQKIKGGK